MVEKIVQTAGREQLGDFAPTFSHLNDDVLFGEVWNEKVEELADNNNNFMKDILSDAPLFPHATVHRLGWILDRLSEVEDLDELIKILCIIIRTNCPFSYREKDRFNIILSPYVG